MAIHIIGSTPADTSEVLPAPEVDLPGPETAPAAHRLLGPEQLRPLLEAEEPFLRAFAVEQARVRPDPSLADAVVGRIADDELHVAAEAIAAAVESRLPGAADAIEAAFHEAQGERAAALATALGRLAPERLFDAMKRRGRLDDHAYPSALTALAVVGGDEVTRFLGKALGRAGMLGPERRRGLYTAILVGGDPKLCHQVLGEAIGDSNEEAPPEASFPSRVAVASLGGLPGRASRLEDGELVFDRAREVLEEDAADVLDEAARTALETALAQRRVGDALRALAPLLALELENEPEVEAELGGLAARRRGLLEALVGRARDVERLEVAAAGIFLAAAAQAASLVVAGAAPEATSPPLARLAQALEVAPATLAAEAGGALAARFEAISPREMRRIHTLVATLPFRRAASLKRFAGAVTAAGHGAGLLAAVGESTDRALRGLIVEALEEVLEDAETAVLEVLDERPLDPKTVPVALQVGARLRTERIGLAVGRRFLELRALDKARTADALLRVGDPRMIPLLEARAFAYEPEETAWVILALAAGAPAEGKLAAALERMKTAGTPGRPPLEVELRCERCGELATYGFARAFVDPEAKDDHGDPAFVGDVTCKACGGEDTLRPTAETERLLATHMLQLLEAMRSGNAGPGLVQPVQITVEGARMGLGAALRHLDERIRESPESIRLRLERARLRLVLHRRGLLDDVAGIRAQDPEAVEATVLEASHAVRSGDRAEAVAMLARAHEQLGQDPEPRLYEVESADTLRGQVEELLLELAEHGEAVPESIDLAPARARRTRRREQADLVDPEMRARLDQT